MLKKIPIALFAILLLCSKRLLVMAQGIPVTDTLKLTVQQAEDGFIKNNLQLIIQRYNIDNASAEVITARLFNNPDFNFGNGIYANDASQGPAYKEQSFGISQLFTTAGKRNKNIRLAKIGVDQAKYQFFDMLRTLKFSLRSDFYSLYFQQQSAKVYNGEISSLANVLSAYKQEYAKGYIAEKELLRIQAQLYSLQAEYNTLLMGMDTLQSDLRILIRVPVNTSLVPLLNDSISRKALVANTPYQQLLDSAYANRYDLRYAKSTIDYNSVNLKLQKATAVPDISLSLDYDKLGGYGNNYLGGGIEFSLPFFNRNQGAIKQAHIAIDQSTVQLQNLNNQIENDVNTSYTSALRTEKLYESFDPAFKSDFEHLIKEVFINYQKKNISLLEFLDFYDSFKTNTLQLNSIGLGRIISLEQLNYVTGTKFFN